MKKIISILILSAVCFTAHAQIPTAVAMTNPNGAVIDTATQAAAEGATIKVDRFQETISIEVPVTKISGTIAGSVKWQGSNNGVAWFTLQTDTLTDATNVYGYSEAPKRWLYYKALITQTGTSSLSYKGVAYYTR